MPKFRMRPVEIEAVQITNATFDEPHPNPEHIPGVIYSPRERCAYVRTLEGELRASLGDWIITRASGEMYPLRNDIFIETYEAV